MFLFLSWLARCPLFRVFILGVGLKEYQGFFLIGNYIFDNLGSCEPGFIYNASVILLSVVITDWVFVVVVDTAPER
jgi:hypothetical protein